MRYAYIVSVKRRTYLRVETNKLEQPDRTVYEYSNRTHSCTDTMTLLIQTLTLALFHRIASTNAIRCLRMLALKT